MNSSYYFFKGNFNKDNFFYIYDQGKYIYKILVEYYPSSSKIGSTKESSNSSIEEFVVWISLSHIPQILPFHWFSYLISSNVYRKQTKSKFLGKGVLMPVLFQKIHFLTLPSQVITNEWWTYSDEWCSSLYRTLMLTIFSFVMACEG